jgi:hypothetical protein
VPVSLKKIKRNWIRFACGFFFFSFSSKVHVYLPIFFQDTGNCPNGICRVHISNSAH